MYKNNPLLQAGKREVVNESLMAEIDSEDFFKKDHFVAIKPLLEDFIFNISERK